MTVVDKIGSLGAEKISNYLDVLTTTWCIVRKFLDPLDRVVPGW